MNKKHQISSLLLAVLLSFGLLISACVGSAVQSTQEPQVVNPTVLITRLVTQIVATPTITPTSGPTQPAAVVAPISTGGWDPFSVKIYYPIGGCVASRLYEDDIAFVANGGGLIGLHMSKDIGDSPQFRYLVNGEMLEIRKGPWCTRGALVWQVGTPEGEIGYVPEGNGETYWLLPMPPETASIYPEQNDKLKQFINEWGQLNFGKRDK